jgi:hypothetical protein
MFSAAYRTELKDLVEAKAKELAAADVALQAALQVNSNPQS